MKALIIAAGNGTRMQPVTKGRHKSLMKLLSLKIIERVILASKETGITDFVIVVGYRGSSIKKQIGDGQKYGVSVKYVENKDWEKANGISVLLARDLLKNEEKFALLMSDHVFEPSTLEGIKRIKFNEEECVLAIDKNLDSVLDINDATKVIVKRGRVVKIGKNIDDYNAFDTGMFICSPHIFKVLKGTTAKGKNSLTNGINHYVKAGNLKIYDNKGNFWADCDTYKDIQFAEKELLRSLTKKNDGWVSRLFNRKISTFMTKFLIYTPLTPNIVSLIILALAIFTFFILAMGDYPWLLIGGLMIQFLSIADGVDGEIARLKFMGSKWGEWIDPILDRYVDTIVIAGMAYGYWNITGNNFILPIASFVIIADIMEDYMSVKFLKTAGVELVTRDAPFRRDARLLLLAVGTITNQILLAFIIFILISQYKVINRFIAGKRILNKVVPPAI